MLTTIYGLFASQIWHFSFAESGFCNIQRLQVHGPPAELAEGLGGADPNVKEAPAGLSAGRRASHTVHFSFAESGFLSIQVSQVHSPVAGPVMELKIWEPKAVELFGIEKGWVDGL